MCPRATSVVCKVRRGVLLLLRIEQWVAFERPSETLNFTGEPAADCCGVTNRGIIMAVHKARLVPHLFTLASFVALNYAFALHAPEPTLKAVPHRNETELDKRTGIITELSTCGYLNGDPSKSRTADSGYNCRIDTRNGLWGFCPTTVVAARDCGLAGSCVDEHRCSQGCGFTDQRSLTTFTWYVLKTVPANTLFLGRWADGQHV